MKMTLSIIGTIFIIAVFIGILVYITGCSWMMNLPQDSWWEEVGEDVIESYTGVDVDITPYSKESW